MASPKVEESPERFEAEAARVLPVRHDEFRDRLAGYHAGLGDDIAEVAMALPALGTPRFREEPT